MRGVRMEQRHRQKPGKGKTTSEHSGWHNIINKDLFIDFPLSLFSQSSVQGQGTSPTGVTEIIWWCSRGSSPKIWYLSSTIWDSHEFYSRIKPPNAGFHPAVHRHPQSWDLTPVWDTHRLENSTAPAAPGGENPTGFFMASDFFSCSRIWITLMGTEAIKGLGREQTAPNFAWAPWSISHSSLGPGTSKEFHGLNGFPWENREKINYIFIFNFFFYIFSVFF